MDGGSRSGFSRLSEYGMAYANSMYSMDNIVSTVSLDLNSRLSDNLSNQFLATYSKLDDMRGTNSEDMPFIDIRKDDGSAVLPYIALGYELFTWNNGVHNTHISVKDDLTYYAGNHKLTAGLNYEYQMADNSYMRNGTGYYRYKSLEDFMNGAAPEVVCLTYGYDGEANPAARVRFHKAGIYAQDEWNATDSFKLTYGVRLDGLFFDNQDLMTNKAIYDLAYTVDGVERHIDTGKWPSAAITASPRVGFSWDVFDNNSLKVRGGTGLFSGRLPLVFFTNMPTNSGMVQYQAKLGETQTIIPGYTGASIEKSGKNYYDMNVFAGGILKREELLAKLTSLGFPNTISPEDGTVPSEISAVDPKFKMPQVWKTSLALDYNFPTSFPFSISAEGIFNKTINGVMLRDWSVNPVHGFARFNGVDNRPIFQNYKQTYESNGKVVNLPNAYVLENTNKGYGYSGTFTVNMRPVEGLSLMAAYTHTVSKELTGMPGSNASSVLNYMGIVAVVAVGIADGCGIRRQKGGIELTRHSCKGQFRKFEYRHRYGKLPDTLHAACKFQIHTRALHIGFQNTHRSRILAVGDGLLPALCCFFQLFLCGFQRLHLSGRQGNRDAAAGQGRGLTEGGSLQRSADIFCRQFSHPLALCKG